MIILRKKHDEEVFEEVEIENTLDAKQKEVGGLIEFLDIGRYNDKVISLVMNEEGKLEELPLNMIIMNKESELVATLEGTILVVATDSEGESVGLTDEDIDYVNDFLVPIRVGRKGEVKTTYGIVF